MRCVFLALGYVLKSSSLFRRWLCLDCASPVRGFMHICCKAPIPSAVYSENTDLCAFSEMVHPFNQMPYRVRSFFNAGKGLHLHPHTHTHTHLNCYDTYSNLSLAPEISQSGRLHGILAYIYISMGTCFVEPTQRMQRRRVLHTQNTPLHSHMHAHDVHSTYSAD